MQFFIKELVFFCIERFFLKTSRQFAQMFSGWSRLLIEKQLSIASIGDVDIGQSLLKKINLFGKVVLDVKTDNPWRIIPFSDEVEIGIDGFSWLNDLAIVNNKSARKLSQEWIDTFPLERLNKNVQSSSTRLASIVRNFLYLEIGIGREQLNKLNKIVRNDYFFLKFYKNFSLNSLERISICHSLVLSGYAFNLSKKKQKKTIRNMITLLTFYSKKVRKGLVRNPEELSEIFFYLLETIEISKKVDNDEKSQEEQELRKISYFLGSSLRYLQFGNGNLISAHGGCLGDYHKYVKLLGEIKKYKEAKAVSDLGFLRLNGARMSMIIDIDAPLYGKIYGIAHAGFSSFELYYGQNAIFVNCGGGSRFGYQYRKYCQSSKAHNVLLFNEKSQCSFGKKPFSRNNSYYYISDGPRNTKIDRENSITEKIVELSHDAYKKDYGISVSRRISMDLVKNCVTGQDKVISVSHQRPRKTLEDGTASVYFHIHPSIECTKTRDGVLLELPGGKKMFFTYKGGNLSLEKSTYIGNFYEPKEIKKLVIENHVKGSEFKINWKIEEIID